MDKIKINTEFIKLDQLLKLAGFCDNGSEAKYTVIEGKVLVNGEVETRRGKKIRNGDKVQMGNRTVIVESI